ncbi:hypothetical protein R1flu_015216 [Riccia fluitans]|uniref:Uncharacterized protein n=1 Tax=Riccia fluitans TaxID=41844 RepID=A0ABD1YIN1_9MARC
MQGLRLCLLLRPGLPEGRLELTQAYMQAQRHLQEEPCRRRQARPVSKSRQNSKSSEIIREELIKDEFLKDIYCRVFLVKMIYKILEGRAAESSLEEDEDAIASLWKDPISREKLCREVWHGGLSKEQVYLRLIDSFRLMRDGEI